jgi:transcriptional regulator with XRE-family HTH domain
MANDQGPVVQSALLRSEVIRLRKESGLTQEQVAADLDWSPSKLIRVEGGRSSITKVDLDALLTRYGVTSESQRERLHALNRGAREPRWWDAYREDISPVYLNYVGYEAGASVIRQFQGSAIPGLLQTPEYAEVLTANSVDAFHVGPVVRLRMQRQQKLAERATAPRQYFVVDEAAVRRHVGVNKDPAIMPKQLRHIAERAERNELITVRVIPFSAGAHPGSSGAFTLLEFEGGMPDVLYLDVGRGPFTLTSGDDPVVAEYADDFERLVEESLPARESIELILRAAEDMS